MSMQDYFKTRGYVPGGVVINANQENMDVESLPPFLRTLLVTDGTVTKSLEAFFWEPVEVENLEQKTVTLQEPVNWLKAQAGQQAVLRKVRLRGTNSGRIYAYAESIIRLEQLPEKLRDDLLAGKIGIGELLRESALETYREILDIGTEMTMLPILWCTVPIVS
jgi:chorismate-pyruvate lyase